MSIKLEKFMKVKNAVMPNEAQLKEFNEQGEEKPIFMVNLLKFKEKAEYPDKRETDLSGEEPTRFMAKKWRVTWPKLEESQFSVVMLID